MAELKELMDVMVDLLKDTYDAELQQRDSLPKLLKAAGNTSLKRVFRDHMEQNKVHIARLEKAFAFIDRPARPRKCKGMAVLLKEAEDAGELKGITPLVDAGIIMAAQKVEHYEIVAYNALKTYARILGQDDIVNLFEANLGDEIEADDLLTEISQGELLRRFIPKP
ncbi:MAG: DUF892 family protein [Candidatus Sumerlaeota bacterium]